MKFRKEPEYYEIPTITSEEFRFIRENAGITLRMVAEEIGRLSRSTKWNWEQKEIMRPYQTKILMCMVPKDLWNLCRKLYKEKNEKKGNKEKCWK